MLGFLSLAAKSKSCHLQQKRLTKVTATGKKLKNFSDMQRTKVQQENFY